MNGAASDRWRAAGRNPWLCRAARGSAAWTRPDRVCAEEAFVAVVATAAHLLRVESKICKAAASQSFPSAVEQTKT